MSLSLVFSASLKKSGNNPEIAALQPLKFALAVGGNPLPEEQADRYGGTHAADDEPCGQD